MTPSQFLNIHIMLSNTKGPLDPIRVESKPGQKPPNLPLELNSTLPITCFHCMKWHNEKYNWRSWPKNCQKDEVCHYRTRVDPITIGQTGCTLTVTESGSVTLDVEVRFLLIPQSLTGDDTHMGFPALGGCVCKDQVCKWGDSNGTPQVRL